MGAVVQSNTAPSAAAEAGLKYVPGMEVEKVTGQHSRRAIWGAVANFVNTAVGAGVIAVPFALHKTGFFAGIILVFVAASLIYTGSCLLIKCGLKANMMDYGQIMEVAYGRKGYYGFSAMICLFLFGVLAAYLVIIGDNWPHFAQDAKLGYFFETRWLSTIFFSVAALPMSLLKDMTSLSWASSIGFISVILIDIIIIVYAPSTAKAHSEPINEKLTIYNPISAFSGLGIISFSMISQHASYLIYNSIPDCTYSQWKTVSWISVAIEVFFVLSIGISGYLSFGDDVTADILESYHGDVVVNAGRVLLTVLMVVTYPMVMFVIRHFVDQVIFELILGWGPRGNLRHVMVTVCLWAGSTGLAILVSDLGVVLGVTGSIGASSLGYLFPAMLCMYFYHEEITTARNKLFDVKLFRVMTLKDRLHMMKIVFVPTGMIIFAVISMVAGSITSFL